MNTSETIIIDETSNIDKRQKSERQTEKAEGVVHAEISIIPIGKIAPIDHNIDENTVQTSSASTKTSMSKEIAVAYNAIYNVKGIKTNLTGMSTQIESKNVRNIFQAVEAAHQALKEAGIKRIITSIHMDERLDKVCTLEDKADSVKKKLFITS